MYSRKKTGMLGLKGVEVKSVSKKKSANKKKAGETALIALTHIGAGALGAAGGVVLGRGGLVASAATITTAAFLSTKNSPYASHLMVAGGGMMAGPAFVSERPSQPAMAGFDMDTEIDGAVNRTKSFLTSGMKKSVWWDKMSEEKPADSIEQEAGKARAEAEKQEKDLGRVVQYTLPEAQATGGDYMNAHQKQALQQMAIAI